MTIDTEAEAVAALMEVVPHKQWPPGVVRLFGDPLNEDLWPDLWLGWLVREGVLLYQLGEGIWRGEYSPPEKNTRMANHSSPLVAGTRAYLEGRS